MTLYTNCLIIVIIIDPEILHHSWALVSLNDSPSLVQNLNTRFVTSQNNFTSKAPSNITRDTLLLTSTFLLRLSCSSLLLCSKQSRSRILSRVSFFLCSDLPYPLNLLVCIKSRRLWQRLWGVQKLLWKVIGELPTHIHYWNKIIKEETFKRGNLFSFQFDINAPAAFYMLHRPQQEKTFICTAESQKLISLQAIRSVPCSGDFESFQAIDRELGLRTYYDLTLTALKLKHKGLASI